MLPNNFGVWARLRREYILNNQPAIYKILLESGKLNEHLEIYQSTYSDYAKSLMAKLNKERGIDSKLKEKDLYRFISESYKVCIEVKERLEKEILSGR